MIMKCGGLADDSVISNNGDRDKVLATVGATILEFKNKFGELAIYAKGLTPARTRLYQMGINAHLSESLKYFELFGLYNGIFQEFNSRINYEAFLVVKRDFFKN